MKKFLEAGKIVSTHGIHGEVRMESWCDSPEILSKVKKIYFENGAKELGAKMRAHKNIVIAKIDGIETVEDAQSLRNTVVYIDRSHVKLEDGQYFLQDLFGLDIFDVDTGERYGELTDVLKTGANDVYVMKMAHREVLIPVISDVVIGIDLDKNRVDIRPMKGLFDDED